MAVKGEGRQLPFGWRTGLRTAGCAVGFAAAFAVAFAIKSALGFVVKAAAYAYCKHYARTHGKSARAAASRHGGGSQISRPPLAAVHVPRGRDLKMD